MNKIRPNLYIGNMGDAQSVAVLRTEKITAVLNVGFDCDDPWFPNMFFVKVGLIDGPGNTPAQIRFAVDTLGYLLRDGYRVMIHCVAGHSRAPYITTRYLSLVENRNFQKVFEEVVRLRPGAENPNRLRGLYGTGWEGLLEPRQ